MKYHTMILCLVMLPVVSMAKDLEIEPGLWETTMTRSSTLSGQEVTQVQKECIKEKSFDPAELVQDMEDCKLTKNVLSGNKLTFAMRCEDLRVSSAVDGEYEVNQDQDQGRGRMNISLTMAGQQMNMAMRWESKRLGDCPKSE